MDNVLRQFNHPPAKIFQNFAAREVSIVEYDSNYDYFDQQDLLTPAARFFNIYAKNS